MKARVQNQIKEIPTSMATGITLKVLTAATPDPLDKETLDYIQVIGELTNRFAKAGWQIKEQNKPPERFIICAKYILDRPDFMLIEDAQRIINNITPAYMRKEWFP